MFTNSKIYRVDSYFVNTQGIIKKVSIQKGKPDNWIILMAQTLIFIVSTQRKKPIKLIIPLVGTVPVLIVL